MAHFAGRSPRTLRIRIWGCGKGAEKASGEGGEMVVQKGVSGESVLLCPLEAFKCV